MVVDRVVRERRGAEQPAYQAKRDVRGARSVRLAKMSAMFDWYVSDVDVIDVIDQVSLTRTKRVTVTRIV